MTCHSRLALAGLLLLLPPWSDLAGQQPPPDNALTRAIDPEIAAAIASLKAFDNHAHPVLPPPADSSDREFDALPVDNMEPATDVLAWRPDNPQLLDAWHALWGFNAARLPLDPAALQQLAAARARVKAREGARYDVWVLDQAGIATMAANRVALGAIEPPASPSAPPRFRWVPYDDALLFPLDNSALAATPDKQLFFPLEEKLRARYLRESGLSAMPRTLPEYLERVVTPTLERQKAGGAIAIKFEIAYLRSFDFANPSLADASRIYASRTDGQPRASAADYKLLQDFLFRAIALEAGRLDLVVHLHTMSGGGGYFGIAGGNPMLLEPIFNDPTLRRTRFVMLHGGWPFVREAGSLLQKPNVYLDLSQQSLTFPPRTLAGWLREWLETFPDKVLFGTDGYPYSESLGWEESTWIASRNARQALGLALTGMVQDGEITRPRALELARMLLSGNAAALYAKP